MVVCIVILLYSCTVSIYVPVLSSRATLLSVIWGVVGRRFLVLSSQFEPIRTESGWAEPVIWRDSVIRIIVIARARVPIHPLSY